MASAIAVTALLLLNSVTVAQAQIPSPFTGGARVDMSVVNPTSSWFASTCDPTLSGVAGGQGTIEIIRLANTSVFSQQLADWPATATLGGLQFLDSLNPTNPNATCPFRFNPPVTPGAQPTPNWIPNPTGSARTTTFSKQCLYASPGCLNKQFDVLQVLTLCANNFAPWFELANAGVGKSGVCLSTVSGAPVDCRQPGGPFLRVTPISKCGVLLWQYPIGGGTVAGEVGTLTDPAGNLYIQHAFQGATYPGLPQPTGTLPGAPPGTPPVPLYPPGWTLGSMSFAPGSPSFAISPLRPNSMCATDAGTESLGGPGAAGCTTVIVVDGQNNGYHRYLWSGSEPVAFPDAPLNPQTRPAACQADCAFKVWAAPAYKCKVVRSRRFPTSFNVTFKRLSTDVAKYARPLASAGAPDTVGKGYARGPKTTGDALAALLSLASPTNPLSAAIVVRAPNYVVDPSADASILTPTGDDSTLVPDQEEVQDDPQLGGGDDALDPGETLDDEQTITQQQSIPGFVFQPKLLFVTITNARYNSLTRSLKVTVSTGSTAPPPGQFKAVLDSEVGAGPQPLKLKRKVELYKPLLWVFSSS